MSRPDEERMDEERMIVLSLKPRFAESILTGSKTVELRRIAPRINRPTRALLYATTPVRALLGECLITDVESLELKALWNRHGRRTGLLYPEFQQYFRGVEVGAALMLENPQSFSRRISLQDLRAKPGSFRPPQSFAYVDTETGSQLMGMAVQPQPA